MKNSVLIKEVPISERPRERLVKYGAENLSTEDLIAIILKTGTRDYSSKYLESKILSLVKNVEDLKNITLKKLMSINGVGAVKAIDLLAAIELGKRVYSEDKVDDKTKYTKPQRVYDLFKNTFINEKQECFYCLYLDQHKRLIEKKLLFKGTINKSIVHPREIFKHAYLNSASSIICVHNHPTGIVLPSNEDIMVTDKLCEVGSIQGIGILDHIIIGKDKYFSFYENNLIGRMKR